MSFKLYRPTYRDRQTRETRPCAAWGIRFRDHLNRRQKLAAYPNERRTLALAEHVEKLKECRQFGVALPDNLRKWLDGLPDAMRQRLTEMDLIDPVAAAADRPLSEHLDGRKDEAGKILEPGYKQAMTARGNTDDYCQLTTNRVRNALESCGFVFWKDLAAPSAATRIEVWLGEQRAAGKFTGNTFNYYVRDLQGFCRWMFDQDRAPAIALRKLKKVKNADTDSERRRSLSVDEMRWLVDTTAAGTTRYNLAADDRAILYRFAFETGIRPGQIRALTVGDFNLAAKPPTVTTQARFVKRRRVHIQELRPGLAADLKDRFKNKLPAAAAFAMPSKYHLAEMLRDDLEAARTVWINKGATPEEQIERAKSDFLADVNQAGEHAVFYSTRHGHGTALAEAGVPEKDIAASMHHATRVTTARYLHSGSQSRHKAIGMLPDLAYTLPMAATGTHDEPADNPDVVRANAGPTGKRPMVSGGKTASFDNGEGSRETPSKQGESAILHPGGGSRTRTAISGQRILSPLPTPAKPLENKAFGEIEVPVRANAGPERASISVKSEGLESVTGAGRRHPSPDLYRAVSKISAYLSAAAASPVSVAAIAQDGRSRGEGR